MVVTPLYRGPGNAHSFVLDEKMLPTRIGYCSNTNCNCRFRCEDNNIAFTNVQPHYYRVRQLEPCHHLGWSSQALILSILALGAMPKQQQRQRGRHCKEVASRNWLITRHCITWVGLLLFTVKPCFLITERFVFIVARPFCQKQLNNCIDCSNFQNTTSVW